MPSVMNGIQTVAAAAKMRYAALPQMFEDAGQVESDWYTVAAVVLLAFNKPEGIKDLWDVVDAEYPQHEYKVQAARRLREAMMKASILVGFPRGINGLVTLRNCFTDEFVNEVGTKSKRGYHNTPNMDPEAKIARGKTFFSKVYAQHTNRVLINLDRAHPDLPIFAIESLYGELLSETSTLNEQSTSLLEMVACMSSNAIPQTKGHVYGARNMGESLELIQQCVDLVGVLAQMEGVRVEFGKMDFLGKIGVKVPVAAAGPGQNGA